MIQLKQTRHTFQDKQTLSTLEVYKDDIFKGSFCILELPWKDNQRNISCIPKGRYKVVHYSSAKYPDVFEITNVPDRTAILIHSGNYNTHTEGCLLIGFDFKDINNDGYVDVLHSRDALNMLKNICKNEVEMYINIV